VWIVDADIKSCIDTIRHRQLMTDLAIWIDDERIVRLGLNWLQTFEWRGRGVAQGAPTSPLFASRRMEPDDPEPGRWKAGEARAAARAR